MSSTLREDNQQEEQGWTPSLGPQYCVTHTVLCHTHSPSPHSWDTPGARCHKHFITPHRDKSSNPGLQTGTAMSYLQVPDLDLRVHGSCSKNESIRVELRTGESCGGETDRRSEPTLKILSTAKVGSSLFLMLPGPALCPAPSKHWQHVFFRTNEQQLNKTLNNIQRLKSPTLRRQLTATRGLIGHLGEHTSCLDVREGPVLKKKRQQSR